MRRFRLMVLVCGLFIATPSVAATPGSPGTATPNPYQTIQPRNVPMPAPSRSITPGANDVRRLPPANSVNPRDNGLPQMQQAPSIPKVQPAKPVKPKVEP